MTPGITIVGLGPGAAEQLTLEAWSVLAGAAEVYLRTLRHPTVAGLPPGLTLHSFDEVYEREDSFASVYRVIAESVIELGQRSEGVVYAVPGHPLVGEAAVQLILALALSLNLPVRVVAGLSFIEPVLVALGLDPLANGLQVVDAAALVPSAPFAPAVALRVTEPVLLAQVYGDRVASQAKLALLEHYPAEHEVRLVRSAGVPGAQAVVDLPLHRLDRLRDLDHLCSLYVPPLPEEADTASPGGLQRIVARLRSPEGCPWDREQTHSSLKANLLEEAHEVLAALDEEDPVKLREELGDLLLQIVLHAQIAIEEGEFTFADVVQGISEKLVRRHPHVFSSATVADTGELLRTWEKIKQAERDERHEGSVDRSLLSGVPSSLPALAYSQAMQERAGRIGFDWPHMAGVLEHLSEEIAELDAAADQRQRLAEFGDVVFSLVNAARWLKIDAEEALRLANQRFLGRFQCMEQLCSLRGRPFSELTFEQKNALWDEVKAAR